MLSLAASLTQKWKQTATFTSRLKMPPETADAIAGSERRVLTNLCQEWLRKFLEFLLSDRDRSRRWPQ